MKKRIFYAEFNPCDFEGFTRETYFATLIKNLVGVRIYDMLNDDYAILPDLTIDEVKNLYCEPTRPNSNVWFLKFVYETVTN